MISLWKPALLLTVFGAGIWFGPHLLIKPEVPPPAKQIHWSSGDVVLSPDDPSTQVTSNPSAQKGESGSGGKLVHTLSELLGIEISIQATQDGLEKGLVLYEEGDEEHRWQLVLNKPKEAPAPSVDHPDDETKPEKEVPSTPGKDKDEQRPFELRPGSTPTTGIQAWVLGLVIPVFLVSAWRSSRRKAQEITQDSQDFQEALRIWLPWLMAKQGTPRAVKRFVNRLRYIAIRLRKVDDLSQGHFPEPNTVAIAAFHYLLPMWIAHPGVFEQFFSDITGTIEQELEKVSNGDLAETAKALVSTIVRYAEWSAGRPEEPVPWPPTAEHIATFLAVINEGDGF